MTGNGQFAVFQNHSNLKPIIWLQAKNDNNQSADSLRAMQNFHTLIDQEICTEWHWQERSPIYPQRFTRTYGGINNAMSESIFEKLVAQDYLDENNYLKIDNINMDFPFDNFIEEFNLSSQAKRDVLDQLNAANADHGAFSDFNKTIIDFFESLCGVNPIRERDKLLNQIRIYPNPTKGTVHFKSYEEPDIVIFDLSGRFILERSKVEVIDLGGLSSGVYIIEIKSGDSVFYTKLIIE